MEVTRPLPVQDLEHVCGKVGRLWENLAGKTVLFTGASGFFGSWMLETFLYAGTNLNLPFRAISVTRNAEHFSKKLPHLANDARVEILEGDITSLVEPAGPVDVIIHSLVPDSGTSLSEMDVFFQSATARLLDIAASKSSQAFLLCSTGAVYQPKDPPAPFSEDDPLIPLDGPLSYGQIRRKVEDQCLSAWRQQGIPLKIARGFAFFGPRLPLDGSFAIGNFLRDAKKGLPVTIRGDGSAMRTYLYASDMSIWLWKVIFEGDQGNVYNVGSQGGLTIGELAEHIAGFSGCQWKVMGEKQAGAAPSFYIPNILRSCLRLEVSQQINLQQGLSRWDNWLSERIESNIQNMMTLPHN